MQTQMTMLRMLCLIACSPVLLAHCADSASDTGGSGSTPTSEMITAKEGGTVEIKGAMVDIPGGALKSDTEITIKTVSKSGLPNAADIASSVYDLGPNGTKFDKPVTLTFDFDASKTPDGKDAVIAWLDDKTWTKLDDSAIDGDSATATTTHFTKFAVIWIGGAQTGGSCDNLDFKACGGDLVGTWDFTLGCASLGNVGGMSGCADAKYTVGIDFNGTVSFTADKKFDLAATVTQDVTIDVPTSCLMGASCDALNDADHTYTAVGDVCEAKSSDTSDNQQTGTYTIDETEHTFTTTADGEAADDPDEYCVKGDMVTVKQIDSDGNALFYQAKKAK